MLKLYQLLSWFKQDNSGAAAIELALVAPFYVFLLIALYDYSMAIYRSIAVQNAAQAGAQYAIANGYSSNISTIVTNSTPFTEITASPAPVEACGCPTDVGLSATSCSSVCTNGDTAGEYVTVSAQTSYTTLLPYPFIPHTFNFSAQSIVRIQ